MEQAGVPRSVAMKISSHKTEAVYRRYAIVTDADLPAAALQLAAASVNDPATEVPGNTTAAAGGHVFSHVDQRSGRRCVRTTCFFGGLDGT
jgi:hypothetical protein